MFAAPITNIIAACTKPTFFGLKPWYGYLTLKEVTTKYPDGTTGKICQIQNLTNAKGLADFEHVFGGHSPLLLIGLAILDDLIRIAAMVAVGFVIYGGIQYVTSQGAPDQTKKAQQTIINALIGLVVAILAASIVSFLGNRIGG